MSISPSGHLYYIEIFYNPKRRHANNGMLSLVEYEMAAKMK